MVDELGSQGSGVEVQAQLAAAGAGCGARVLSKDCMASEPQLGVGTAAGTHCSDQSWPWGCTTQGERVLAVALVGYCAVPLLVQSWLS